MKIGINTFGCDHGMSGIGSYILSLVHNMPNTAHKIELFGHELDKYTYTSGVEGVRYTGVSVSDSDMAENMWHRFSFNSFVRKQNYDIALFPSGLKLMPLRFDIPAVLVIQNIIDDTSKNPMKNLSAFFSKQMLRGVKGIICPSEYIKQHLLQSGIPEEKLKVIHNGIDTSLFYPRRLESEDALLIQPFAIRRPYIIYASRITYPSKCHLELLEAFALFKRKTKAPHRLVIAGADGEGSEHVHQAVLESPVASDIFLTGYFPHQNLPELYSAADICIFPSSSEGVGLSVIEAMACGIPTACARAGALPEVAGDCTLYFNQQEPDEIAQVIEQLVYDGSEKNTLRREQLVQAGLEWVKKYRWVDTGTETLNYLEEVYKK